MRVCIFSQCRLEFVGGVESYVKSLSSWLSMQQNDVILICRGAYKVKTISSNGRQPDDKRIFRISQSAYTIGLFILALSAVANIISENKKKKIDIIHCTSDPGYAGFTGVLASKIIGIPLCVSVHSYRRFLLGHYLKGLFGRLVLSFDFAVERLVYSKADKIIVVSAGLKNYVASFGIKQEKIIEIPVAIQLNDFNEFNKAKEDEEASLEKEKVIIGYVGRLEREKNLFALFRAFEEIVKIRHDIYLVLVGDGSLNNNFRSYAETANISENIWFTGEQHNIPNWLKMFDIFILPSFTEGMPISLLEAMAAAKAIIASDIPGIREIVKHNEEGILVNPYNVEALQQAILLLCNDSGLRARLGHRARKKAMLFDVDKVYAQVLSVYEELLYCISHVTTI